VKAYALYAIATVSTIPFTLLLMETRNGKLLAASEEETGKRLLEGANVKDLVRRWGILNAVRCFHASLSSGGGVLVGAEVIR
jgi:hypothetical protein